MSVKGSLKDGISSVSPWLTLVRHSERWSELDDQYHSESYCFCVDCDHDDDNDDHDDVGDYYPPSSSWWW